MSSFLFGTKVPRRRRSWPARPGLLMLALLAGCAQHPAATTAAPQSPATEAGAPSPGQEASPNRPEDGMVRGAYANAPQPARAGIEPPDGVWLLDEAGNEFYIEKMPRYEGKYKWISETQVKYLGVKIDVEDVDEDWFYVKVYRVKDYERSVKHKEPTAEELAAVAKAYEVSLPSADKLRLEPYARGLPATGQWRNGFDIADMNADGRPDIVHSPPRKGGSWPVIFLNQGDGSWVSWRDVKFPNNYDYGDVAVGDFNGDGNPDIGMGIHLRGIRILVGDGKGAFREWSQGLDYQVPGQGGSNLGFSSRAVRVLDWNGDGRDDLLALGEGPRMGNPTAEERRAQGLGMLSFVADGPAIFLNQGDGTWVKRAKAASSEEIFGDDLAVGDFNGDGRIDFATSSSRMARQDLINLSDGEGDWTAITIAALRPMAYIRAVQAAELNGDGKDDLIVAYLNYDLGTWRTGIDIYYSGATESWDRRGIYSREGRVALYSLDLGDLNGDGAPDLVTVDADGGMLVFLGDGRGSFVQELSPEAQQPRGRCRGYRVRTTDLDGDGRSEVIADYADEASAFFAPDRCLNGGGMMAWKVLQQGASGTSSRAGH